MRGASTTSGNDETRLEWWWWWWWRPLRRRSCLWPDMCLLSCLASVRFAIRITNRWRQHSFFYTYKTLDVMSSVSRCRRSSLSITKWAARIYRERCNPNFARSYADLVCIWRHQLLPVCIYRSSKKLPIMSPPMALGRILVARGVYHGPPNWWASCCHLLHAFFLSARSVTGRRVLR